MSNSMFHSKYLRKSVKLSDIYANKDEDNFSTDTDNDSQSEEDMDSSANFIIDSKPDNNLKTKTDFSLKTIETQEKPIFSSQLKPGIKLEDYFDNKTPEQSQNLLNQMSMKSMTEELKNKSVIKAGFEQQYCIEPFRQSKRLRKKLNKIESSKTAGNKWFNMPSNELTEEKKNDLMALSMRRGWDPKRFYKKNDSKQMPKFFQIGTVIESAADYYHSRVPKKDRKRTLVEELLADSEFKRHSRKKYSEALAKNPYYLKMKRKKQRQELKSRGIDFKTMRKNKKQLKKNKNKESQG